jgi:hypothetical protein
VQPSSPREHIYVMSILFSAASYDVANEGRMTMLLLVLASDLST